VVGFRTEPARPRLLRQVQFRTRWHRPGRTVRHHDRDQVGAPGSRVPIMSTETEYIRIEDGVLEITLSTAARGTSLDFAGVAAGTAALAAAGKDVGAVLLTGSGPNFCAGGDVRGFAAAEDRSAHLYQLADTLHVFVRALDAAPVPVVAALHGWAAGAGMSLVCTADIAVG